ncbi:MAG TPA: SusC/RagA family TonB-linked outer membrane protein [Porphyromonadaceae bacterium]|nr:SusC/RagA family TonB-linked outer membrane protein [Porphyromonadaceae bacterium]
MKVALIFLFIVSFQLAANSTKAQDAVIELQNSQITVGQLINEIEKQTDYLVVYSNRELDTSRKINLKHKSDKVSNYLRQALHDTDMGYDFENNYIVLSKKISEIRDLIITQQPGKTIRGTIVDNSGAPIIGANVIEVGKTSNGTMTDTDGNFSLQVGVNAILHISYIGYLEQKISTVGKTTFNIVLQESTETLKEVVVTALGIKREEKALGYSVQKVSGESINTVKSVDFATNLTGKVAGLDVQNSTEFNETPTLQLRGETPLLVIDGIPYKNMTLRDIASDDIESIDILKGATASALYGARGGSGAIMITSKRAKKEGVDISVNSSTMFNAGYLKIPEVQTSYSTGQAGEYLAGSYVWGNKLNIGREALQWNPQTREWEMQLLVSKGKNNLKNFQELSFVTNNNISITQKGRYGSFRTSLTHIYNKGQWPNEKLNKLTYTVAGEMNLDKFKSEAGLTYNKRFYPNMGGKGYGGSGYLYNLLIWSGTDFDIRDYKNYWLKEGELSNWMDRSWYENPYLIANEVTTSNDYNLMNAYINTSYEITPWLKMILRSGADFSSGKTEWQTPIGTSAGWGSKKGYYGIKNENNFSINNDFLLIGEKSLNDFAINGFFGGTIYYYNTNMLTGETKNGIILPEYYSLAASVEPSTSSKSMLRKQVNSLYGKMAFSWKSTVFIETTGRNDWSSTLSKHSRSYFYPSVSGSIIISEFVSMPSWVNFWKFRTSWTKTKNDAGIYDINTVYNISTNVWNDMSAAYNPRSIRSITLRPSTSRTYEIGTVLSFLDNRLRVDYTYYNKSNYNNTRDVPLSPTTGYTNTLINFNENQLRQGHELTITADIIKNKNLNWSSIFNWARDRYYYEKIDPIYSTQKPWIAKGKRWDWVSVYDYQRNNEGSIIHDASGLPLLNPYESLLGYSAPDWTWGFSNSFHWKNFSIDIGFDGRIGGIMFSKIDQALWNSGAHIDSDNQYRYEEVVNGNKTFVGQGVKLVSGSAEWDSYGNILSDNRVFAPNDIKVSYEIYQTTTNPWVGSMRSQNYLDPTFIKLRNFAINYSLPKRISEKMKIKGFSIGVVGQNLWIWTKAFRFSDPDKGLEDVNSPSTRLVGFNMKFDI